MNSILIFILLFTTAFKTHICEEILSQENKSSNEVTQNAVNTKSEIFPWRNKRYEDPDYSKIIIYIPKQDDSTSLSDEFPLFDKIHKTIFSFFDKIMKPYREDATEIQENDQVPINLKNNICQICNSVGSRDHSCENKMLHIIKNNILKQSRKFGSPSAKSVNTKDQEKISTRSYPLVNDFLNHLESKRATNNLMEQDFNKIDNLKAFKMANDIQALKAAVILRTKGIFEETPNRVQEFPITKDYIKNLITGNQKLVGKDETETKQTTIVREQKRELKEKESEEKLDTTLLLRRPTGEVTRNLRETSNVTEQEDMTNTHEDDTQEPEEVKSKDKREAETSTINTTNQDKLQKATSPQEKTIILEDNPPDLIPKIKIANIEDRIVLHIRKSLNKTKNFDAHNFLLSSGGTKPSTTALNDTLKKNIKINLEEESVMNQRGKRQLENATTQGNVTENITEPQQTETVSDTIPEVVEVETLKETLEETNGEIQNSMAENEKRKVRNNENIEHTEIPNTPSTLNTKNDPLTTEKRISRQNILAITLPSVVGIAGIILILCYITRAGGWFCTLFNLQANKGRPTSTSQEEN